MMTGLMHYSENMSRYMLTSYMDILHAASRTTQTVKLNQENCNMKAVVPCVSDM